MSPTVTCDLTGGLGNQLFILCATLAYAYEHNLPVALPRFEGTHGVDGSARPAYWDTLFRALAPLLEASGSKATGPVQRIGERDAFTHTPPPPPSLPPPTATRCRYHRFPLPSLSPPPLAATATVITTARRYRYY